MLSLSRGWRFLIRFTTGNLVETPEVFWRTVQLESSSPRLSITLRRLLTLLIETYPRGVRFLISWIGRDNQEPRRQERRCIGPWKI